MSSSARQHIRCAKGNVLIMLVLTLSGVLAVAAVVIDTTLYLMRRQEVQALAESVATAAALNLPQRIYAELRAKSWYDKLRVHNGREVAPDRNEESSALTISFDDNYGATSDVDAYRVTSITVKVTASYATNLLKVPGVTKTTISVVGQATAQLKPTDVVMIIEDSGSFALNIDDDDVATNPFVEYFPDKLWRPYAGQCFNNALLEFKKGAVALYDILSEIGTFRVSVIHTSSRTGEPFVTAQLGQTKIMATDLEYQGDQPDYPSTRCMLGTQNSTFRVPAPLTTKGSIWIPRVDLSPLALQSGQADDYSVTENTELSTREAIWIRSAGRSTRSARYHNPNSLFVDPRSAISLAEDILTNSRRDDGKPVGTRVILYLTDGLGARLGTAPDAESITPAALCPEIQAHSASSFIKYGIIYFGHRDDLEFHGWDPKDTYSRSDEMRKHCLASGNATNGMFVTETSPEVSLEKTDFKYVTAPLVAHAIKEVELVE